MADLRERVKACAKSVRDSGVGPAQMILSIKSCAREGNKQYPAAHTEHDMANADFLMDQIIKWAIVEYYNEA